jgi:hypothetical protein
MRDHWYKVLFLGFLIQLFLFLRILSQQGSGLLETFPQLVSEISSYSNSYSLLPSRNGQPITANQAHCSTSPTVLLETLSARTISQMDSPALPFTQVNPFLFRNTNLSWTIIASVLFEGKHAKFHDLLASFSQNECAPFIV